MMAIKGDDSMSFGLSGSPPPSVASCEQSNQVPFKDCFLWISFRHFASWHLLVQEVLQSCLVSDFDWYHILRNKISFAEKEETGSFDEKRRKTAVYQLGFYFA